MGLYSFTRLDVDATQSDQIITHNHVERALSREVSREFSIKRIMLKLKPPAAAGAAKRSQENPSLKRKFRIKLNKYNLAIIIDAYRLGFRVKLLLRPPLLSNQNDCKRGSCHLADNVVFGINKIYN
jgi:hypothetical protein